MRVPISGVTTCPLIFLIFAVDVIKTRYLSDCGKNYTSIVDCVQKTFKGEGFKGFMKVSIRSFRIYPLVHFFKGWVPAYWRIGPYTVMTLLMIEEVRTFLGMNNI